MPHRLAYYLEQAALADQMARESTTNQDRVVWVRIAEEWRKLHKTLSTDLEAEGWKPDAPLPS